MGRIADASERARWLVPQAPWLGLSACLVAAIAGGPISEARADGSKTVRLTLFADTDDDNDDGVPDGAELAPPSKLDVQWIEGEKKQRWLTRFEGDAVRVIADGQVLAKGAAPRSVSELGLQGLHAGEARLELSELTVEAQVIEFIALDSNGKRVDLARSHASITRILPQALSASSSAPDSDSLSWLVVGPAGTLPTEAKLISTRPDGSELDTLEAVELKPAECPPEVEPGLTCRTTEAIRATVDDIDRSHPEALGRSLRAEVGGRLALFIEGRKAVAIRVGGPRASQLGPIARYRSRVRLHLVRLSRGGSVPIGTDQASAIALGRDELRTASSLWGQCGIHFGYGDQLDVAVVDPPEPALLAVGCDAALPASGGLVSFRVGSQTLKVPTDSGQTPTQVANRVAQAVRRAGLRAVVSANPKTAPGALRTADVLIRHTDGKSARIETGQAPLSTDSTLNVCLGEVDLSDGLDHFSDLNAAAGTLEERSLIKAFDDADPTTIEVFIVPHFARSGRIGESFIYSDGASIRNAVILDRAGVRSGARSFALAHELGHVLLDMPGHPDDFGVDQPSSLMDADAADATIFGPRRLSVSECERALLQTGPGSFSPLLSPWPLYEAEAEAVSGER